MKKYFTVLLLILVAAFAFANGEQEADSQSASAYRDHFIAGIDTMPSTFNPGSNTAPVLNDLVWDELVHYNKVTREFEPCLATSWKWIDSDSKILHMDLRKGVKFHNGNDFTAADVEYSLSKCANANVAGSYDHSVINDDYSIDIYLKNGNADFVYVLTNTLYAGIIDKESCEKDPDNGSAFGTGPWMIDTDNSIPGDTIELKRNDAYWGPIPGSKLLTLRYIKSNSSRLIALQNDEIQAMMTVATTDINTVKNDSRLEYKTGANIGPAKMYYISFNMKNGVAANNVYLRQAVARIMNRQDIIAASGDADAVVNEGIFWGVDTPFRASLSECKVDLSENKEEALKLVEKAKELYPDHKIPTLHLVANTSKSINMSMCLIVQQECASIGIPVEIDESDSAGILARTKYDNPKFDMVQYNVPLESWASAANRMFVQHSNNNRSILDNDHVTDLLTKAAAASDEKIREQYYKEVQIFIHDNAIYIPAYYGSRNYAQLKGVEGVVYTNDGYPEFAYATMAK